MLHLTPADNGAVIDLGGETLTEARGTDIYGNVFSDVPFEIIGDRL